jgi:hypothetical protein
MHPQPQGDRRLVRFRFILIALLLCAGALAASGCGNLNRVPRYDITGEDKMPKQFKRYARHDEQDFLNRMRAEAYYRRTQELEHPLSADQKDVILRHGQPDYIRRRFKSTSNELVDQWVWWDRDVTTQFVQGQLVWEGPLTDMDKTLVKSGYPSKARFVDPVPGTRRDIWIYEGVLQAHRRQVTFTDEQLTSDFQF